MLKIEHEQIEKGLQKLKASLRSSGVNIKDNYLDIMCSKLKGEITADEFLQRVREEKK